MRSQTNEQTNEPRAHRPETPAPGPSGRLTTGLVTALLLLTFIAAPHAAAQEPLDEPALVDTLALAALSPEELFLRASSAALQFAPMIQPSRRILVRDHERSLPYLVGELDTDGPRERHALEDILVRIGEPAVEPLIDALDAELERTDTLRGARMAASILGRLDDERATPGLTRAARHEDWKVRSSVAGALGRIGDASGLDALLRLLDDENEIVRKSAAVALRRMATVPDSPGATSGEAPGDDADPGRDLSGADRDRFERSLAAREAVATEALKPLVDALGDAFYQVRYSAAAALAELGPEALGRPIMETALVGEGPGRLVAISVIGRIGDPSALGPLGGLLLDDDWAVRGFAAEAIGRIGADRRARKALSKLLARETHPFVRMRAGEALAPME